MNNKVKGIVYHITRVNFNNKETGEINSYCKVDYLILEEPTENTKGYLSLECYSDFDDFGLLCNYVGKQVELELSTKMQKVNVNGSYKNFAKFSIKAIDGKVLS